MAKLQNISNPVTVKDVVFPYDAKAEMYQPHTHAQWLTENSISYSVQGITYYFKTPEEALMFYLVWG